MNFLYPVAFTGMASIALIVLMYLMKQKHNEIKVSSTMLWRRALKSSYAQKPWQKLRKSILMLLQILAAFLLVTALAGPFISGMGAADNYIIVLDASYSMQADNGQGTLFDQSRQDIINVVDSAPAGSMFSLIIAEKEPYIAVHFSGDRKQLKNRLASLSPGYTSALDGDVYNLAETLYTQNEGTVYVFSAHGFDTGALPAVHVSAANNPTDNMAITLMSHSIDRDRIISLVKVGNYGRSQAKNTVALYADDLLVDMQDVVIKSGESADVFFTNVPYGAKKLSASLLQPDVLLADDVFYDTVQYTKPQRAILFTERNVFLENIMALLPDIELYRGDISDMEGISGYYLYIFDGVLPEILPEDGHLLLLNPPENNSFVKIQGEAEVESIFTGPLSPMLNFVGAMEFGIAKAKIMENTEWGEVLVSTDKSPLIIAGETGGRKAVIMGFDLHQTDLPLKKEFPIFMYNLSKWFVPGSVYAGQGEIKTGDTVAFHIYPDAEKVQAVSPTGGVTDIAPPFPATKYSDTGRPGFYVLSQEIQGTYHYSDFAVNVDIEARQDSDFSKGYAYGQGSGPVTGNIEGHMNLRNMLLVVVLILIAVEWYVLSGGRLKAPDTVRMVLILLVALSLADLDIKKYASETSTVFAVDVSASVAGSRQRAAAFINEALSEKPPNDSAGIIVFGKNAAIESLPAKAPGQAGIASIVDSGATNIADGLVLARTVLPEDALKRIVLISDGNENAGDAIAAAKTLKEQDITLDVWYIENNLTDEAQLTGINVPQTMGKNMNYNIEIVAHSLTDGDARLALYKNGDVFSVQDITLSKGENRYVFSDISDVGGHIVYRAELQPAKDTVYQNNNAYAYSYVEDIPAILIVSRNGSGNEAKQMLEGAGVYVNVVDPQALPVSQEVLNVYDTVFLADISADDMPEGFMDVLETYVKSGGGLIATGGENAFALGGYYGTPLEEVLPVEMELKDKSDLPNLGMVVVLDRSGSMESGRYGLSKMALAKEAVIRSVDALNPADMFGVLAFDDKNLWPVDMEIVGSNAETIKNNIAMVNAGGGTSILPALEEAYGVIKNADTKLKHIILLTDGQAEQTGYDTLMESMRLDGITLSAVAVGSDSDTTLLEGLADKGGGRYYYTDEFTDLPKIFTKETFLAGKTYLNHVDFFPVAGASSPVLSEIDALPMLNGYVATTAKPRADVALYAEDDAPLLASWQYGLGRSIAFTSDVAGMWTKSLLSSEEGVRLIRNMVSWTIRQRLSGEISAQGQVMGTYSEVALSIPYDEGVNAVSGKMIGPDLTEEDVLFSAVSPGIYKTQVQYNSEGAYILNLDIDKSGVVESISTGVNIPYAKEYDITAMFAGLDFLKSLANAGGGMLLTSPEEVFRPVENNVYTTRNLAGVFMVAAIIWLLFDIAFHKFSWFRRRRFLPKQRIKLPQAVKNIADSDELKLRKKNLSLKPAPEKANKDIGGGVQLPESREGDEKPRDTASLLLSGKKKRTGR